MKNILNKIDKALCYFFGLEQEVVSPYAVALKNNKLIISNTTSFKRHYYSQNWDKFGLANLKHISQYHKEKLGIAMGKAIAKNLVITFEEIEIHEELADA
ncbi:MAG: hypothetical protein EPO11_07490 [Gammaproteobacteria bacterium]|nr:MAG: hypothetical protein EPO11_07490 [Gammaproteobacteria bacterium]